MVLTEQEEQEAPPPGGLDPELRRGVIAITPVPAESLHEPSGIFCGRKQIESFICGGEHLSGELIQLLKLHSGKYL